MKHHFGQALKLMQISLRERDMVRCPHSAKLSGCCVVLYACMCIYAYALVHGLVRDTNILCACLRVTQTFFVVHVRMAHQNRMVSVR